MQKKIIGILIMMLFISSSVIPITIIVESNRVNNLNSKFANKYAWSGKGHGLDNKGVISVIVPSSYPVYLVFSTRYEIFSPDSGRVELSADGGTYWYPMDMITGVQSDWTMRSVDISSFIGMPVLIRFRYSTGSYSTSEGWYVDSVSIKGDIVEDFESYNAGDNWGDWIIIEEAGNLPPSVGITFPKNDDIVKGTVIITGEAHDPNGDDELKWVMLKIGNLDWSYADGTSSWSYVWDTTIVNDGSCLISAITSDGALQSTVFTIVVTVDNIEGPGVQPDLIITDIWDENNLIYYQIRNIGDDNASSGHHITLFVDNENKASDLVEKVLAPGERYSSYFDYSWDCTGLEVLVSVYADYKDILNESNETNNIREEKWKCDTTAPKIIDGPSVQGVSQSSATIYWKTDEVCDSTVSFDRYAGEYNNIVRDSKLVNVHSVVLNGLMSGTVYHFMVESMDASGNSFKSRDYYFATKTSSDNKKPSLYPHLPDVLSGIVDISVDASDNVGVDRVHFSCDDEPIFTVYSPPHEWGFYTGGLMDGVHDFGFDVFDDSGNSASESLKGAVINKFPPDLEPPLNVTIFRPELGEEINLSKKVNIYAKIESKIDTCLEEHSVFLDDNVDPLFNYSYECPPWIGVLQPGDPLDFDFGPYIAGNREWNVSYQWDPEGYMPDGPTRIEVHASDVHGNYASNWVEFTFIIPPPEIQVFRDVERIGNYYRVEITLRNTGIIPIRDFQIWDTNVGFQCDDLVYSIPFVELPPGTDIDVVGGTYPFNYPIEDNYFDEGDYSQIQIDVPDYVLAPGDEIGFGYYAVPVLFDPLNRVEIEGLEWWDHGELLGVPHVIGHDLFINYYDNENNDYSSHRGDLRWDLTINDRHRCEDGVIKAFRDADYLIVTSPTKLDRENAGSPDVNELLVTLAKLARLKNGVLGYTYTNSAGTIHDYIDYEGVWWDSLCYRYGAESRGPFDYLLLVGETEIIPSFSKSGFDVDWEDGKTTDRVDLTDLPFADIYNNDNKPDISVGRIIGNCPTSLIKPIKTSIDIHRNIGGLDFDRSHALLISGTGKSVQDFIDDVRELRDTLEPDIRTTSIHWSDYYHISRFPWWSTSQVGFAIGDVVGDDKNEIIIADQNDNYVYVLDKDGNRIVGSGFDFNYDDGYEFTVGDIVHGGKEEIIIGDRSRNRIYIYDNDNVISSFSHDINSDDGLAVGNVLGDFHNEIVIASCNGDIYIYNNNGDLLRQFDYSYRRNDLFAVGNVMDDEHCDIIFGNQRDNRIFIYDADVGVLDDMLLLKSFDNDINFNDCLATGDVCKTDLYEEIIIGTHRLGYGTIDIYWYNSSSNNFLIYDSFYSYFGGVPDSLAVGNVIGSDKDEILVHDLSYKYVLIYDAYYSGMLNITKDNSENKDIIVFIDHGNENQWSPALDTSYVNRIDFGNTKPFLYALCCLTGDYENDKYDDDYNIAEAFFDNGAAVYIGATEISPIAKYGSLSKWFFNHWDSDESIGKTFTDLKRHYWGEDGWYEEDLWRLSIYEFNLYGDPKFGIVDMDDFHDESEITETENGDPPTSIEVVVPDYEVTSSDGFDYVEIPGGEILSVEEGKPRIPYYNKKIEYPKGYRVQDVILKERSGLVSVSGLNLPVVILCPNTEFVEIKGEWYPTDIFNWRVEENNDGSRTLIITMYPFYYNLDTAMLKFYKNYDFDIEYVYSDMTITALDTDKYVYKLGDNVKIDLWFENKGYLQDFIAKIVIKQEITEEIIDGLPLRSLQDFSGVGSYSVTWNSPNNIFGSYIIEASITDTSGNILDIIYDTIYFETPSIAIKSIRGGFGTSAVIEDTGMENLTDLKWSININGNMVFLGGYKEGNIPIIEPGETYHIKSGFIIGFGPAEIIVNVAGVEKTISCFLLGPFVLNIK